MIAVPDIDPVAIYLGPIKIYWYGLAYIVGIGLGWLYIKSTDKFHKKQLLPEEIDDLIFYTALGAVIGGRLGYCLFYDFNSVILKPLMILAIWNGGMSFHGGLIGATCSMLVFSKVNQKHFLEMSDRIVSGIPIGLFLGRIANFINQELWGLPSNVPWAVIFSSPHSGGIARHPSQLYEAFCEGLIIFAVLYFCLRKGCRVGVLTASFLILYGIFRFTIEFFREPDLHLGYFFGGTLTLGQILTIPMLILGIVMIIYFRLKDYKDCFDDRIH